MKIKDLQKGAGGIEAGGVIGYVKEKANHKGMRKSQKGADVKYDFDSQFIVINNVKGEVKDTLTGNIVELTEESIGVNIVLSETVRELTEEDREKILVVGKCKINEYTDSEKKKQKTLQAGEVKSIGDEVIGKKLASGQGQATPSFLPAFVKELTDKIDGKLDRILSILGDKEVKPNVTNDGAEQKTVSAEKATPEQVKLINTIRKKVDIDETKYRDFLVSIGVEIKQGRNIPSGNDIPKERVNDVLDFIDENRNDKPES